MSSLTALRLLLAVGFREYADEILPILRRMTVATAMEFRILSKAVRTPAFMNIHRASEMLEDCFQVMAGFRITAKSPIGVEFGEE
jgi:hypothetical protein